VEVSVADVLAVLRDPAAFRLARPGSGVVAGVGVDGGLGGCQPRGEGGRGTRVAGDCGEVVQRCDRLAVGGGESRGVAVGDRG
jgi:hypothetical protein